jgi:hypothetical protein
VTIRSSSRRRFLLDGASLLLIAPLFGSWPTRGLSTASPVNVRTYGAVGDGVADDTTAIQATIDALPQSGGTVYVPAGTYRIDATRSIRPRSGTHLQLDPDAVLVAIPNDQERHYVIWVENVTDVDLSGGHIIGERDHHLGKTGEWGFGVYVRAAHRVRIRDMHISRCWGDGVCIGALLNAPGGARISSDVTLERVTCTENRRQGLSIGPARRITVIDCEFSHTGGTRPGCGIDIEPEHIQPAQDIDVLRCRLIGNAGCGIQVYENVFRASIRYCTISDNAGYGVLVLGAAQTSARDNHIGTNGLAGLSARGGATDCAIAGNTFDRNGRHRLKNALARLRRGAAGLTVYGMDDIEIGADTEAVSLIGNRLSG